MSRDPRRIRVGRNLTTLLALATALMLLPLAAVADETVTSVKASAYGASANVNINKTGAAVGPAPSASIPSSGGSDSDSASNVDLGVSLLLGTLHVVDTGVLNVSAASTNVGSPNGEATSESSVSQVNLIYVSGLLPAVVHADAVTASCSADADGVSGSTRLVGASVSDLGSLSATPAPNTNLSIPDVGTLWLNRQTTDGSGNLTVTGLQLVLDLDLVLGLLGVDGSGTINIARAVCGVNTQQIATTTTTTSQTTTSTGSPTTSTSTAGATSTSAGGTTASTTKSGTTTSTSDDGSTTTTVGGATTTTLVDETTTTILEDFCAAEDEHDGGLVTVAANNNGTGFGALRIGGSASMGNGSPLPVILNILILLVAAALGAIGGYAVHKFGLFDRMARLKGAGL